MDVEHLGASILYFDKASDTIFPEDQLITQVTKLRSYIQIVASSSTYGHRLKNTRHPVRSAIDKLQIEQLVVGSVTTSESCLLYVFDFFLPYVLSSSPSRYLLRLKRYITFTVRLY